MIFHYIEIIKDKYKNNKDKIIMGLTIFIIMLLVFNMRKTTIQDVSSELDAHERECGVQIFDSSYA